MVWHIILTDISIITCFFPLPCGARKSTTQLAKYPHVLYFFCILINFYSVMYYNFLHTDLYERVGKIKKEKKTKHIYIVHTHTHTHYSLIKKEKKNTPQYILLYLHEKISE